MGTAPFCFCYNKEMFSNYLVAFCSMSPFDALLFHSLIESQHSNYLQNNNQTPNLNVALIWCEILDLAYCVNDLQLLFADNMFTKAWPLNISQSTGGLSCSVEYSFGSKQSTILDFVLAGRNSSLPNKKADSADFHGERSFRDHLHAFDMLWIDLKKVKHILQWIVCLF